jgi:hypothetical protein
MYAFYVCFALVCIQHTMHSYRIQEEISARSIEWREIEEITRKKGFFGRLGEREGGRVGGWETGAAGVNMWKGLKRREGAVTGRPWRDGGCSSPTPARPP